MSSIDLNHLRTWIGKSRGDDDLISVRHAKLMAATVDCQQNGIYDGASLPPLWHWIYFLEGLPAHELGSDGHPARGGFMPPVPLHNRMWAGGRVTFISPVIIGTAVRKESSILKVDHKQGRSGDLVFVTVLHLIKSQHGDILTREEQDIVYKDSTLPPSSLPVKAIQTPSEFSKSYTPTSTMLFRYSALTFNGHRIHYDVDYCREHEGYKNLVVHGPLNATMLAGYAEEICGSKIQNFNYQGVSPALLGSSITLNATLHDGSIRLTAALENGAICMQAEALTDSGRTSHGV